MRGLFQGSLFQEKCSFRSLRLQRQNKTHLPNRPCPTSPARRGHRNLACPADQAALTRAPHLTQETFRSECPDHLVPLWRATSRSCGPILKIKHQKYGPGKSLLPSLHLKSNSMPPKHSEVIPNSISLSKGIVPMERNDMLLKEFKRIVSLKWQMQCPDLELTHLWLERKGGGGAHWRSYLDTNLV